MVDEKEVQAIIDEESPQIESQTQETPSSEETATSQPTSEVDDVKDENEAGTSELEPELTYEELQNRYKSVSGKMSQLEKERNEYLTAAQRAEKLEQWIEKNPVAKRAALRDLGYNDDQIEQAIAQDQQRIQQSQQQSVGGGQIDPQQIEQYIAQKTRQEIETYQASQEFKSHYDKFLQAAPELDPKNIKTEAERYAAGQKARSIVNVAWQSTQQNGGSLDENLVKAYKFLTNKTDEDIAKAREKGKYEGMAMANTQGNGAYGEQISSKSQKSPSSSKLSESDNLIADIMGWDKNDYANFDQKNAL